MTKKVDERLAAALACAARADKELAACRKAHRRLQRNLDALLRSESFDVAEAKAKLDEVVKARNYAMRQCDEERKAKEGNIRALNAALECLSELRELCDSLDRIAKAAGRHKGGAIPTVHIRSLLAKGGL